MHVLISLEQCKIFIGNYASYFDSFFNLNNLLSIGLNLNACTLYLNQSCIYRSVPIGTVGKSSTGVQTETKNLLVSHRKKFRPISTSFDHSGRFTFWGKLSSLQRSSSPPTPPSSSLANSSSSKLLLKVYFHGEIGRASCRERV